MADNSHSTVTVVAGIDLPAGAGALQVSRYALVPVDAVMREAESYRLNLCLTPRPIGSRACFPGRWGPHRFEPIGEIFLVPPGHELHVRSDGGAQVAVLCELPRASVERWLEQPVEWTDRRLEAALNVGRTHLRTLLSRLAEEAHNPDLASTDLAALAMGQIAIELARFCTAIEDGPTTGGLAAWRLRAIDERLRDVRSPPTLADLAALCGISVRQLTRGFRVSRGSSIADYIARGRNEGAKRLLAGTDSVKAIAFAMGFASASSFAYAFRRANGVTPRQFRQSIARASA